MQNDDVIRKSYIRGITAKEIVTETRGGRTGLESAVPDNMFAVPSAPSLMRQLRAVRELEREAGPDAAENALNDLAMAYPDASIVFAAKARLRLANGRVEEAETPARRALSLCALDPRLHSLLGVILFRNGDVAGAEVAFGEALAIDKAAAHAHICRSALKLSAQNMDDALAIFDRVLALDPDLERAYELVARLNAGQGSAAKAVEELQVMATSVSAGTRAIRAYLRHMRHELPLEEKPAAPAARLSAQPLRNAAEIVRAASRLIAAGHLAEAEAMIGQLRNRGLMRSVSAKLHGDMAVARGNWSEAVDQFRRACDFAGIAGPDRKTAQSADEETARSWQLHTADLLKKVIRDHRERRSVSV